MVFAYWAHTKENKKVNFISTRSADIGDKMSYKGEIVTIDDWAVDRPFDNFDAAELRTEARIKL